MAKEHSAEDRTFPAGSPVLVFQDNTKYWEGPYPIINIDGETVCVQLQRGRRIFRSIVVRPLTRSLFIDPLVAEANAM